MLTFPKFLKFSRSIFPIFLPWVEMLIREEKFYSSRLVQVTSSTVGILFQHSPSEIHGLVQSSYSESFEKQWSTNWKLLVNPPSPARVS